MWYAPEILLIVLLSAAAAFGIVCAIGAILDDVSRAQDTPERRDTDP